MTGTLYISASQIETFELCNRKWWFDKAPNGPHLPTPQRPYFAFGTCLHSCLERWILSTPNGRVPSFGPWKTGISVVIMKDGADADVLTYTEGPFEGQQYDAVTNLFPNGFEVVREKDGTSQTLTPNEAAQVKKLVHQAIERGIIVKGSNVRVEHHFELQLIEGVKIVGYLDLLRMHETVQHVYTKNGKKSTTTHPLGYPEVHDHKSHGKGSIRFLAQPGPKTEGGALIPIVEPYQEGDGTSPNCVGHKQQNLTYAWATCKVEGYAGPVLVRHNQFPKFDDGKGVRYVEALIAPERLEKHGQYLQAVAGDMVRVSKIKEWEDTPPPKSLSACTDFGGCQFQDICSHRVNLAVYSERTNRFNQGKGQEARPNLPLPTTTKTTMANVFDKARQQRAQQAAPEAAPTAAPTRAFKARPAAPGTVKDTINGDAAPEKETVTNGAPWANPGCPACLGLGMNSRGMPCPICDKTAPKRGVPVSDWYEIDTDARSFLAVARAEHAEAIEEMGAPEQWEYLRDAAEPAPAKATPKAIVQAQGALANHKAGLGNKFARKGTAAPVAAAEEPEEEPEAEEEAVEEAPAEVATASTFGRGRGRPPGSLNKKTIERNGEDANRAIKVDPDAKPVYVQTAPAKAGPGRPRSGITLCLGAVFLEGPVRPRMMAQTLLESLGKQMAEDMGAASFYELDQYKRQDRLRQAGAAIAADLGRTEIIFPASMNDFDLVALHTGLAPHAENIIGRLG